jgi:SAM-dependent methyltransferase
MIDKDLVNRISKWRRVNRRRIFESRVKVRADWKILDVGCGESWRAPWFPKGLNITGVDLRPIAPDQIRYGAFVQADATALPFRTGAFDFAYSNSLIEHVGSWDRQMAFAKEMARVSKYYWVQTPNTNFPVDPHYFLPFFQHLPRGLQKSIAYRISGSRLIGGYYITRGWNITEEYTMEEVHGLSPKQLSELYPGAEILHQRFAGLSQSIVAAKLPA